MAFLVTDPDAATHVPKPLTDAQMRELEKCIWKSNDASRLAKQIIIWVLRQTKNLTENVALSIPKDLYGGTAREVQAGAHDMVSANRRTRLDLALGHLETEFHLMSHCGRFGVLLARPDDRQPEHGWSTIWWSYLWYATSNVRLLRLPTEEELEAFTVDE